MDPNSPALFSEIHSRVTKSAKVDPAAYKVVSVRLREGEFASFSHQTAAMGVTNNMALRIAARRITGFLEIDAPTRKALQSISRRIGEISENISDISENLEDQAGFDMEGFARQRAAFGAEFVELDRLLRTLLNVSRRRSDGCALLEEARK